VSLDSRATLETVARTLGVSQATVSKVVNGKSGVSPSTRQKVQVELERFSYRSPSQRRTPRHLAIDFVCVDLGPYSVEILRGLIAYAAEVNVEVTVSTVSGNALRNRDGNEWADQLTSTGKNGLILLVEDVTAAQTHSIRDRGVPVVVIDPLGPTPDDVVSVGATNWAGGKLATDYLLGLGHKRVAFVGGLLSTEFMQARMYGYLAAMKNHDLAVPDEYITSGPSHPDTGIRSLQEFLALPDPPTAIFASSDDAAIGILDEARRHGLNVPGNLSVVGFDDTYLAALSVPKLTTVAQPLQDIGRMALRTVIRLVNGESLDSSHVELATRLVERDSAAPAVP
jgi:LacI family transcriptional regulator